MFTLTIAQNDGPALAGQPASPSPASSTAIAPSGAPAAAPARGGLDIVTLVLLGLAGALFLQMILGARREKKKFEAMMASIKKNDQVRTVGGIIGSVVEVKPDVVILKVDEGSNTKITVVRSKIEGVVKESTTGNA